MDGVTSSIKLFVEKLIEDIPERDKRLENQRNKVCNYLKNPLPLDSSAGRIILHTQELKSVGDDAERFFKQISMSTAKSAQDRCVFCVAATSGIGKTHLAYATGKLLTTIVIRVAKKPDPCHPYSAPWSLLARNIKKLDTETRGAVDPTLALMYVKLLICCYVDATLIALEHGKSLELSTEQLRELALRFNRNGTVESIVRDLFEMQCEHIMNFRVEAALTFTTDYRKLIDDRFLRLFPSEKLLLCFDEIQELLGKFPKLFVRNSRYLSDEPLTIKNRRDLFYGVSCAMESFTRSCNWAVYMTGTHLSISKLYEENGVSNSLLRNRLNKFAVKSSLMNRRDMKDMIQFYWEIPDTVFTDDVMDALEKFSGRPYFFIEGAFTNIYVETCDNNVITAPKLLNILSDSLKIIQDIINDKIHGIFLSNKPIVGAGDKTVRALIPALIKSIICGSGELYLRGDPDISQAIIGGVILSSAAQEEGGHVNIKDSEPLVFAALTTYISEDLPIERLMTLVLNQIHDESGATAEEMFVYWAALTAFKYMKKKRTAYIPLGKLLDQLFDGASEDYPKDLLNMYKFTATKVLDIEGASLIGHLNIVNDPNDASKIVSINTDTVFFKIDESSGVDIAFVVEAEAEAEAGGAFKLVAIQSKNNRSITVKEVLMTLSPGLQYLRNDYRELVVFGTNKKKTLSKRESGIEGKSWKNWYEFCSRYDSSIGNNWIRIALVSRRVDGVIHKYIADKKYLERDVKKTSDLVWTFLRVNSTILRREERAERAKLASQLSPLLFLSLSSTQWLTPDLKNRFVNVNADDGGMTFPTKGKESKCWIPVSVQSCMNTLSQLPT